MEPQVGRQVKPGGPLAGLLTRRCRAAEGRRCRAAALWLLFNRQPVTTQPVIPPGTLLASWPDGRATHWHASCSRPPARIPDWHASWVGPPAISAALACSCNTPHRPASTLPYPCRPSPLGGMSGVTHGGGARSDSRQGGVCSLSLARKLPSSLFPLPGISQDFPPPRFPLPRNFRGFFLPFGWACPSCEARPPLSNERAPGRVPADT